MMTLEVGWGDTRESNIGKSFITFLSRIKGPCLVTCNNLYAVQIQFCSHCGSLKSGDSTITIVDQSFTWGYVGNVFKFFFFRPAAP